MKVKELIAELETQDQDADVCFDDGEDEEGFEITGIETDPDGTVFLISEGDEDEEETDPLSGTPTED